MDYLYYSIVDIVDNLPDIKDTFMFNRQIKNAFYDLVKANIDEFISIIYKYQYPNIDSSRTYDFYKEIYKFYINNVVIDNFDFNDFPKELLRQMLKAGYEREGAGFLENNVDLVMFKEFEFIYIGNPLNMPNAKHVFDEEKDIIAKLEDHKIDYSNELHMVFVDSKTDIFVQLSDAVVGFVGKLSTHLYNSELSDIGLLVNSLGEQQIELLKQFFIRMRKSELLCPYFTNSIMSDSYLEKFNALINFVFAR